MRWWLGPVIGISILIGIAFASCNVTPTASPISPLMTVDVEGYKTATPKPIPDGGALWNPSFEQPYSCPASALCLPQGWNAVRMETPPCRPGKPDCELPCPTTCRKDNGVCVADNGCYWASPEIGEATLQFPYRLHSGSSALKIFSSGRMWDATVYQQFYHVPLYSMLHFSVWAQAWQCSEYINCRYGELSDFPASMNIRVGIDPFGGADPYTSTVIWSDAGESFDHYSQFEVTAQALNQVVTVFVRGAPRWDWPRGNGNDLYLDDARLEVLPPPATPTPFVPSYFVYLPLMLNGEY